ncbi:MAG: radical SAM protein [Thermodesulfobacteriota bacterium]
MDPVLFINPPLADSSQTRNFLPPTSLLYLAGTLKASGFAARLLDLNLERPWQHAGDTAADRLASAVHQAIAETRPGLIGITCAFAGQFPRVRQLAAWCKAAAPDTPVVLGGTHPTLFPAEILRHCPAVDFIVIGEGETQLRELVAHLATGGAAPLPADGFAYRDHGEIVVHPKTRFAADLDALPSPDYGLIRFPDYQRDVSAWYNPHGLPMPMAMPLVTSRSCPHRCPFCSMWLVMGPRFRARSAIHVADEIQLLMEEHGQHFFYVMDDNFTFDKARILTLAEEVLRRGLRFQFMTPNGLNVRTLDRETVDALAAMGAIRITLAIESGSDFIRNHIMRKGLPRERIFRAMDNLRRYPHIQVMGFFIMGMPEETAATLEETVQLLDEIQLDGFQIFPVTPYPGTALFAQCLRDNLFLMEMDLPSLWEMDWLGYFSMRFFIKPYAMTIDELAACKERFDALASAASQRLAMRFSPGRAESPRPGPIAL